MKVSGRSLARSTLYTIAGQGIPLLVALPAVPLIVRDFGPARFGLLGLAWLLLGYFAYFDLGMGRAATRFAADAWGRGDRDAVGRVAWSAAAMQVAIGIAGAALIAALAPAVTSQLLRIEPGHQAEATATLRVLALGFPVVLATSSFRGVLEAGQRFDLVALITVPAGAMQFLAPLAGGRMGWSLTSVVAILVATRVVVLLAFFSGCSLLVPGLWRPAADRAEVRRLLPFGAWTSLSNILSPVFDAGDRLLLGALHSMSAVGFYTVPQEIISRTRVLPHSMAVTLFPAFAALSASGKADEAAVHYGRALATLLLVFVPGAAVLILSGPDLLRWWLGAEYAHQSGFALQVLAVGLVGNAAAAVPLAYLQGVNRPDLGARNHLIELVVFLGLAWWLMPRWAVAGAAMVWSARALVDFVLMFAAARSCGAGSGQMAPVRAALLLGAGIVAVAISGAVWLPGPELRASAAIACCIAMVAGCYGLGALPAGERLWSAFASRFGIGSAGPAA